MGKRVWLKAKRISQRLKQREIADKAEISRQLYCSFENGKRCPKPETAKKIAAILNFDWTAFYDDDKK